MNRKSTIFFLLIFSLFFVNHGFCEDTNPKPYEKEEFPGFLHDLRRAEIITLGAMPFVTFNIALGYSFSNYAIHGFNSSYFVNPFANSSDENAYSSDEQLAIIVSSLCISAGIGLTDFIVHSAKRNRIQKILKNKNNKSIEINPIYEDPEAIKIDLPPKKDNPFESEEIDISIDDEIPIEGSRFE